MNWEAIGAIGEVFGAFAVVLTLFYLARETGKNARAVDATSLREVAFRLSEWHRHVADSPELKRIMQKSQSPTLEVYTPEEWFEFHATALSVFLIYQTQYMHSTFSVGSREESVLLLRIARGLLEWPAWAKWWEELINIKGLDAEFMAAVENVDGFSSIKTLRQAKTGR